MSKDEIREIAGDSLEERTDHVWILKNQYKNVTPGVYPYHDSREVYLYFDRDDRLGAIIVRGSYNVYP